jgi:hypothetical protein
MEKKLTAQGPKGRKSYTLTLPIDWVKSEKLDKTRSVDLTLIGRKIVISKEKDEQERVLLDASTYPQSMYKILQGLYRQGTNEIQVEHLDSKMLTEITYIIETRLIGYEIVEQRAEHILIKDITGESNESFDVVLRRIFLLILELAEAGSSEKERLQAMDRSIKKLGNYAQRILMKKGHFEFTKTPTYYLLLDRLEKICDELKWLLKNELRSTHTKTVFKEVSSLIRSAYALFYQYDAKKFNANQERAYQIKNELRDNSKMDVQTMHLHNIARQINSLYGDIFILKFK